MPRIDQLPAAGFVNTADLVPVARLTGTDPYGNPVWTDYAATFPVTGPVTPAAPSIGRNYLHNPRFIVQQRGPGPWTATGYTVDRWTVLCSPAGSRSVTAVALIDADRAAFSDDEATVALQYAFVGGTGVNDFDSFGQRVDTLRRLSGKTVALSFWARTIGPAINLGLSVLQYFGTGGSPSANVTNIGVTQLALTTAWTRYTAVVALPSLAGMTLGTNGDDWTQFTFLLSTGTYVAGTANVGVQSGTAQFRGMQVEVGVAATALEASDPVRDLANCQRSYQTGQILLEGYQSASLFFGAVAAPIVTMRVPPTVLVTLNASTNISNLSITPLAFQRGALQVIGNATVTGACYVNATYAASADN